MIDFGKPFGSAWTRMTGVLFRSGDAAKWFVLGFTAWLAGFLVGANSFSLNYGGSQDDLSEIVQTLSSWGLATTIFVIVGVCAVLALLTLLVVWVGARGQFLFLDNVVHNRALVGEPWKAFRRQGNSLFLLYVGVVLFSLALAAAVLVFAVVFCWEDLAAGRLRELSAYGPVLVVFGVALVLWVPLTITLFFLREFGVPLMYGSGCGAWEAARRTLGLATERPLDFFVYLVVRMVMGFVFMLVAVTAGCLTCCVGFFPYLGTVLTLPLPVFRMCYTLDCLAQFGPEYNLWSLPPSPPPPLPS